MLHLYRLYIDLLCFGWLCRVRLFRLNVTTRMSILFIVRLAVCVEMSSIHQSIGIRVKIIRMYSFFALVCVARCHISLLCTTQWANHQHRRNLPCCVLRLLCMRPNWFVCSCACASLFIFHCSLCMRFFMSETGEKTYLLLCILFAYLLHFNFDAWILFWRSSAWNWLVTHKMSLCISLQFP